MSVAALVNKLQHFTRLSSRDKAALERMCRERIRHFDPGEDIARQGDPATYINVVIQGWAWRYKYLADGRRQVTSFFLPGDICDLYVFVLRKMDHFIGAITPVSVAQVSRSEFDEATLRHPRVLHALLWDTLVSASIQREWTVNLGQRTGYERVAHLFCETFTRLRTAGKARGRSCDWPLRQAQIADAVGLSPVHVNRIIQELRAHGLIELNDRILTVPDIDALMAAALFERDYLHLDREGRHLDANEP